MAASSCSSTFRRFWPGRRAPTASTPNGHQDCGARLSRRVPSLRGAKVRSVGCPYGEGRTAPRAESRGLKRLATSEPLDFLEYVSILLAALDPRAKDPFERTRQQEAVTVPALVESFAEVVLPETTALLAALAQLAPDELSRGQGAAGGRGQPARGAGVACPAWRDFGIAGSTVSQRGYQVIQAAGPPARGRHLGHPARLTR